jgi:hypothetical protein
MDQIAQEIVQRFGLSFWTLVFQAIAFIVVALLLKVVGEGITAWIMFRLDDYVCIGTPVEIKGEEGRIKKATWSTLVVETKLGYHRIPMKDWKSSGYKVLKDQRLDRRSTDNESS